MKRINRGNERNPLKTRIRRIRGGEGLQQQSRRGEIASSSQEHEHVRAMSIFFFFCSVSLVHAILSVLPKIGSPGTPEASRCKFGVSNALDSARTGIQIPECGHIVLNPEC